MYSYFALNFNLFKTYLNTFSYIIMLIVKFCFAILPMLCDKNYPITTIWFHVPNLKSLALTYNPLTIIQNLTINCVLTFFSIVKGKM